MQKKDEYMSVQKINLTSFNSFQKLYAAKQHQNTHVSNSVQKKQTDLKDMPFCYPVSFGSTQKISSAEKENKTTFEDSIKKHFRLNPDKYQIQSAQYIYENADPLVTAPTGTGKTLIAEYAINKNLEDGRRTFYTTPLKALSNEKYTDFCKLYGKDKVGLMTGDIKINPQAPIVIMTTEIYRNMLVGDKSEELKDRLEDVATVIYDEFHYMNEPERGEVWETSIMYTPPELQQLLLSATADNADVIVSWMNRLLREKGSDRTAKIVNVPPEERHVPLKYYIFDEKRSNRSTIPLTKENYNLQKLGKALNPDSKTHLTDKQKEVLSQISIESGQSASPEAGLAILMKKADMSGPIENLEKVLVNRLNYDPIEAQRAAAILADKAQRHMNEALKASKSDKEQKSAFYSKGKPQRVISPEKVNDLLLTQTQIARDESRALMQFSRLTGGDTTVADGLIKISDMLRNTDMGVKEFEKRIKNTGLNEKLTDKISHLLTVTRYPEFVPQEFDLINILEQENKLPAIFFKFSKKSCNNLRDKFLKTGKSLLTDDEKEQAAQIIKKHIEKGGFLGTGEDPSSLLSGVAVHHAGKMPAYKALVEELAQNKLLKVVFATSTLGAGINVPAKTVVFTELTRYAGAAASQNGEKFVPLTPSEFQQMAGRAGRRGKDSIGNVIIMPDKDHGPNSIYNLVIAKPDPINSSFKPTYSFISHFIAQDGTEKNLPDAVDKSFLKERLESAGIKAYKSVNKVKDRFKAMSKVLVSPEMECFKENKEGKLVPTIKGEVVAKARGIDGLVFAETLFNSGLEHLTPQELCAVACALTQADERDMQGSYNLDDMVTDTLMGIDRLYKKIETEQLKANADVNKLVLNRADAQYVAQWANADGQDSRAEWEKLIKENTRSQKDEKNIKRFEEGNFLKSVKDTVDILEQIKESARFAGDKAAYENDDYPMAKKMRTISENAKKAISLLNRDPVAFEL